MRRIMCVLALVASTIFVVPVKVGASSAQPGVQQWYALTVCESGHRNLPPSPYDGYFQFDGPTFQGVTGLPGRAYQYPAWLQWGAAIKLYHERGTAPWPNCGWHLRM